MDKFLSSHQLTEVMGMFTGIVCLGILVGVPVIAGNWYRLRVKQWEMSLKHTMLERGMSADEIKTVLEASTIEGDMKKGCWTRGGHV